MLNVCQFRKKHVEHFPQIPRCIRIAGSYFIQFVSPQMALLARESVGNLEDLRYNQELTDKYKLQVEPGLETRISDNFSLSSTGRALALMHLSVQHYPVWRKDYPLQSLCKSLDVFWPYNSEKINKIYLQLTMIMPYSNCPPSRIPCKAGCLCICHWPVQHDRLPGRITGCWQSDQDR